MLAKLDALLDFALRSKVLILHKGIVQPRAEIVRIAQRIIPSEVQKLWLSVDARESRVHFFVQEFNAVAKLGCHRGGVWLGRSASTFRTKSYIVIQREGV